MLTASASPIVRPAAIPPDARTPRAIPADLPRAASDPCFSCRLPDCDESSRRCGLKAAARDFNVAMYRGALTPDIRARAARYFAMRKIERAAAASEAGR